MPRKRDQARPKVRCGAKGKRSGEPCRRWALIDDVGAVINGRCRLHGGRSTGAPGNTNGLTHGIYTSALREDEKAIWERVPIGGLDDEIRVARLQLKRALAKRDEALEEAPDSGYESTSGINMGQPVDLGTTRKSIRDWDAVVDRCLRRVEALEARRIDLLKKERELGDGSTGAGAAYDPGVASGAIQRALRELERYESRSRRVGAQG